MFQDRLQKLREQHGYSVKEAAAALHLPYTTYNNYEKNTREPNGEILCRIAAFFSVSLDYLLGATSTHSNQTVSPEEQAVYTKLQALDSHPLPIPKTGTAAYAYHSQQPLSGFCWNRRAFG